MANHSAEVVAEAVVVISRCFQLSAADTVLLLSETGRRLDVPEESR